MVCQRPPIGCRRASAAPGLALGRLSPHGCSARRVVLTTRPSPNGAALGTLGASEGGDAGSFGRSSAGGSQHGARHRAARCQQSSQPRRWCLRDPGTGPGPRCSPGGSVAWAGGRAPQHTRLPTCLTGHPEPSVPQVSSAAGTSGTAMHLDCKAGPSSQHTSVRGTSRPGCLRALPEHPGGTQTSPGPYWGIAQGIQHSALPQQLCTHCLHASGNLVLSFTFPSSCPAYGLSLPPAACRTSLAVRVLCLTPPCVWAHHAAAWDHTRHGKHTAMNTFL